MLTPEEILGPTGRIAARLEHYEQRGEQLAMAEAVAGAIAGPHHLIAEAGTGVGKSFAYLVPAILAVAQGESADGEAPKRRIVISTHTISLQEQLMAKDLPLLNSVIPLEFSAVLVKGRHNYLSLRRLELARPASDSLFHDDDEFDQTAAAGRLVARDERRLAGRPRLSSAGRRVGRSRKRQRQLPGPECPTYKECFYYRARRRMQNAQILIVNHALFFSDLALRRAGASILPDYDVVIFDEAHNLEAVASDHLGVNLSSGQVEYMLGKLYNERTNRGLLVHHQLGDAQREVQACRQEADEFFADVADWLARQGKTTVRVNEPEIVDNRLSPALVRLARTLKRCAAASAGRRAARFHLGGRSAARAGRRSWTIGAVSARAKRCIGSTRRAAGAAGRG